MDLRCDNVFILGFFHPWLILIKKSWNFWGNCTKFFFGILFPKANWYLAPKSVQILSFYNILHKSQDFLAETIKEHTKISTEVFYNNLVDFVDHILPFIFLYREALKRRSFSLLLNLQPKLWFLLQFMGCNNYSRAILF